MPSLREKLENALARGAHNELAAHYEQEALALRAKAEEHDKIARSYVPAAGVGVTDSGYYRHCKDAAVKFRAAADAMSAVAKVHGETAPQTGP